MALLLKGRLTTKNILLVVYVCVCLRKPGSDLLELDLQVVVSHLRWCWELTLEEQEALLTTVPSLQPCPPPTHVCLFYYSCPSGCKMAFHSDFRWHLHTVY